MLDYGKNFTRDLCKKLYDNNKQDERRDVWLKCATQSNFKVEHRWHPSSKPLAVINKIVYGATEPNEVVLDMFGGGGTTGLICEKLNRRWIMIEVSEQYCEIAKRRIEQEFNQGKLKLETR